MIMCKAVNLAVIDNSITVSTEIQTLVIARVIESS
jgi:hypothetical protein